MAGSLYTGSPSTLTWNVSGFTRMSAIVSLNFRSFLPIVRQRRTGSTARDRPKRPLMSASYAACETNVAQDEPSALPVAPNMSRYSTGSGVGMDAFASPMRANRIEPPLITISGFAPNNAGCHSTKSAILPTSTEPT